MEGQNFESLIAQAKELQTYLFSVVSVTTAEAEQQCPRLSYPHPLTDLPSATLGLVFQYLDWRDCARAAQACFSFQKVIYSRPFQVMVYRQRAVLSTGMKPTEAAPVAPEESEVSKADYSRLTKEQILLETKKANAVITYLSEKFASQKRRSELIETEVEKAKTALRIQTQLSRKTAARARQLEEDTLFEDAVTLQTTLEREKATRDQQLQNLAGELKRCEVKKEELGHHKVLLKRELKRIRQKLDSDKVLLAQHTKTMDKIQRYFQEMHAPRIEAMRPDVKGDKASQ